MTDLHRSVLARAAMLGLAAGGRSTAGLVALASSTSHHGYAPQPLAALSSRAGTRTLQVMGLGEAVADKLPWTPSRLHLPALTGRLAAGALGGWVLAQREDVARWAPAVVGAAASGLGSVLGTRWRAAAGGRGVPDTVAALVEDGVVTALALAAARRF